MENTTKPYEVQPADVVLEGLQKQYKKAEILFSFYENEWKALVKKWDGKVYNKRFRDAVTNALKEKSPLMFMREEYSIDAVRNASKRISLSSKVAELNYNIDESFYIDLFLTGDGRIDAENTLSGNERERETFKNHMEAMRDIMQHYDVYMEEAQHLYDAILKYNKLPLMFRQNIAIREFLY